MSTFSYTENKCTSCTPYEGEKYTALRKLLLKLDSGDSILLRSNDETYKDLYSVIRGTFDSSQNTVDGMLYTGYRPAYSFFLLSLLSHLDSY